VDESAASWRRRIVYAMRDHLIRGVPLKDVLEVVGKVALVSYQAITMHTVQAPLREALPTEVMNYLPRTVVVKVDPKGKITEVTDRFKNEYFTLAKKAEHLRFILKNYNRIAKTVKADLRSPDELTRLSALVTSIIMETGIRPGKIGNGVVETVDGKEEFVETFGAATLGPKHIKFVRDNFAQIEFVGKMGSVNTAVLSDAAILKVLKDYVAKALKQGSQYVFVTKDGTPYDYKDLERYFAHKFEGINPTDFRKLRATEEVLNAIIEEQSGLYERLRKLGKMKKDALKQAIVDEVVTTLQRAIERSQGALSHDNEQTTIDSYIHPGVLFRFLSTGRLDANLSDLLATGKTELKFDPEAFLRAAMEGSGKPSPVRVAAQYQFAVGL
jgi:integrase